MNRLILAALPLLMLALAAGAGASIRTDGSGRTASEVSEVDADGAVELSQHEETYGDDNYYGDQRYEEEYSDEYTDEYGNPLPEDQAPEEEYDDEYADDEYADDEGYEEEYTDEQGYEEKDEYDDATQDDYY